MELAAISDILGHASMSDRLRSDALRLKEKFQKDFWMEGEKFVGLAVDGEGQLVESLSSNAGHCLFAGILDEEKAQMVADRLMQQDFSAGWGIRTLSGNSIAFNPVSYHNGTIWPHDNSMIATGLRKLGRISDVHNIMLALFEAATAESNLRLPELYCGFERSGGNEPVNYPVSCSPQAWAAGAFFQLLKTCMNFVPDATRNRLTIVNPALPEWLGTVVVKGIKVGRAELDLAFEPHDGVSFCRILRKQGKIKVIVES